MIGSRLHPVLYEINTWVWLHELTTAAGSRVTLATVPDRELQRLANLGIDGVWLMGVWQRSPRGREIASSLPDLTAEYRRALPDFMPEDVVGSPYAVRGYHVDAAFGGSGALAALRERLRRFGLLLILDFVPNHLALDHPWVSEYPERFVHGSEDQLTREPHNYFTSVVRDVPYVFAHGRDPNYGGWTDTVQLDYRRRDTRQAMCDLLVSVAAQCDGVRCDMAMLASSDVFLRTWGGEFDPPDAEFWSEAIDHTRRRVPGFMMIAEVYWNLEYRIQQLGFDYAYDKRLYDRLAGGDAEGVRAHLSASVEYQRRLTRFIENHDEPRAIAALGRDRSRAAAVVALTIPGMRLVHDGQIEGRRIRIPVQLGRRPWEPVDREIEAHYAHLLSALDDRVFHEGAWQQLHPQPAGTSDSFKRFLAHQWTAHDARRLIVVNWSAEQAQCLLPLDLPAQAGVSWRLIDLLGPASYLRDGGELSKPGLYLDMPAYGYHLFDLRPR
jgi:glycosidase